MHNNACGNVADDMLHFKSPSELEAHFTKHGSQFKGLYSNADEYLAGANRVIQNGTFNANLNGYTQFYRVTSRGQNLHHFVGITRGNSTYITTYFPKVL